ncbi:MAG: PDZ domain-containing protein [Bacteroidales bacterium]|nr:PDZ domain-containing protein [Bacteroidales bacterium]
MVGTGMGAWLLAAVLVAAPTPGAVPKPPLTPPPEAADPLLPRDAWNFAETIADLAERIADEYAQEITPEELLVAGLTELYTEAGLSLPNHFRQRAEKASSPDTRRLVAHDARLALGSVATAKGVLGVILATEGFNRVLDPYCGFMPNRNAAIAASQSEFGLGLELEGANGPRWLAFQAGWLTPGNGADRHAIPNPVVFPWRITRVLPGSPAAQAGLRPDDRITHINGDAVTARNSRTLISRLLTVSPLELTIHRPGTAQPIVRKLVREAYVPESFFGVQRWNDGSWDYWLDKDEKIAYIRIGTIESETEESFRAILNALIEKGVRGLVLDLRWCPGGYVVPTTQIAGMFLPEGKPITHITSRHPERNLRSDMAAGSIEGREAFVKLPMIALVGPETIGGGEMIAAALQDHKRCPIAGQRTFGKANVMMPMATRIPGLSYKISTGYSLRPNGENRHRFRDSKPTDPWGVRPDRGWEIPLTLALNDRLQASAERQAIRPRSDRTAVAFDDPLADPQKLIAAKFLREQILRSVSP